MGRAARNRHILRPYQQPRIHVPDCCASSDVKEDRIHRRSLNNSVSDMFQPCQQTCQLPSKLNMRVERDFLQVLKNILSYFHHNNEDSLMKTCSSTISSVFLSSAVRSPQHLGRWCTGDSTFAHSSRHKGGTNFVNKCLWHNTYVHVPARTDLLACKVF